jgi:RHS repeat-associated protein
MRRQGNGYLRRRPCGDGEEEELRALPSFDPVAANPVQQVDLNYELTDHLGNVCAVVTGRLLDGNGGGTPKQAELVSAQGYEPFGSLLPGRNFSSSSYRYLFQGQEHDDELNGSVGTSYAFEYRIHDPRIGRFLSIDPLASKYPHNSPYAFSENDVIGSIELEGLEKVALAGAGIGDNYVEGDARAFEIRARRLQALGYRTVIAHTGADVVNALVVETSQAGYVGAVQHFSHGGPPGMYLDPEEGFYATGSARAGENARTVASVATQMEQGNIRFSKDAVWLMGSCHAAGNTNYTDFGVDVARTLGITTIAATGLVSPENVDGRPTGRMKTKGSFIKIEFFHDVTHKVDGQDITHSFRTRHEAEAYNEGFNSDGAFKVEIKERMQMTNLGKVIDPRDY